MAGTGGTKWYPNVTTTNRFHFLSDDEDADPSQILANAAEIKKAKGNKLPRTIAPTTVTNLAPKPDKPKTENAERRPPRDGNRGAGRGRGRGDRITGSGGQEERRPHREGQEERRPPRDGQDERRPPRDGNRGAGRGRGRGDRITGSGGQEERRPHRERQEERRPHRDGNRGEAEKPVGITFSEWKEKNKAVEIESFNVRKPNEDKKLNLAPLKKEEDAGKDNEEFVILRREPREKHVDISVNFAQTNDRGARDGFSRGRDGFRGGRGERPGGIRRISNPIRKNLCYPCCESGDNRDMGISLPHQMLQIWQCNIHGEIFEVLVNFQNHLLLIHGIEPPNLLFDFLHIHPLLHCFHLFIAKLKKNAVKKLLRIIMLIYNNILFFFK